MTAFQFGDFRLIPSERRLLRNGQPCIIGGRAIEVLTALVQNAGQVVGKEDLIEAVWGDRQIEETSLRVQITTLRKILRGAALGEDPITNVPGRGYCLTAPVRRVDALAKPPRSRPFRNDSTLLGRDGVVATLHEELRQHRLVTLVGPGGIGKTSVALAVSRQARQAPFEAVAVVELATASQHDPLAGLVSTALGLSLAKTPTIADLAEACAERSVLLVLDNCEHLIDGVAVFVEALLDTLPQLRILTTSREQLRARGEWVHRLAPLALPSLDCVDAKDALAFPTVELFVLRAMAVVADFELTDDNAIQVIDVCHRLDGIPLAIELAAARLDALGLAGLTAHLEDRFSILTHGRRTALPRQQTLRATLDWSFDLLTPTEQRLLAQLSIFVGWFDLAAVTAVTAAPGTAAWMVATDLASLVAKSLVTADTTLGSGRYCLLETTRSYAAERLDDTARRVLIERKRQHLLLVMEALPHVDEDVLVAEAAKAQAFLVDDVRATVDAALKDCSDLEYAAALLSASAPIWLEQALSGEFQRRAIETLDRLAHTTGSNPRLEMRLAAALGHVAHGSGVRRAVAGLFEPVPESDKNTPSLHERFMSLVSLLQARTATGDYAGVVDLAEQVAEAAEAAGREDSQIYRHRGGGWARHLVGDQVGAETSIARALQEPLIRRHTARQIDFHPLVFSLTVQARVLWLRGRGGEALASADAAEAEALAVGHAPSLFFARAVGAGPLAQWSGDAARLATAVDHARNGAQLAGSDHWRLWLKSLELVAAARRGALTPAEADVLSQGDGKSLNLWNRELLLTFHDGLFASALAERLKVGQSDWTTPEVLRVNARLRLARRDFVGALRQLEVASKLADQQGAAYWALRSGLTRIEVQTLQGAPIDRRALARITAQFDDDCPCPELAIAERLLDN